MSLCAIKEHTVKFRMAAARRARRAALAPSTAMQQYLDEQAWRNKGEWAIRQEMERRLYVYWDSRPASPARTNALKATWRGRVAH
jgi:hypothetical protein